MTTVSPVPDELGTTTSIASSAISIVGEASVTCTANSPDDTVTFTFLPFVSTRSGVTVMASCDPVSVTSSTTDVSLTTYTDDGSGRFSEISSESADTRYSGFTTTLLQSADRIGRTLTPSSVEASAGLNVPWAVVSVQFFVVDRINNIDDLVVAFSAQNGHVASRRALSGVRSTSPGPPVHWHGSLVWSTPENENRQVLKPRSKMTTRFEPGQFESYTDTSNTSVPIERIWYGRTA